MSDSISSSLNSCLELTYTNILEIPSKTKHLISNVKDEFEFSEEEIHTTLKEVSWVRNVSISLMTLAHSARPSEHECNHSKEAKLKGFIGEIGRSLSHLNTSVEHVTDRYESKNKINVLVFMEISFLREVVFQTYICISKALSDDLYITREIFRCSDKAKKIINTLNIEV